ncbi:MAG: hypothetical protein ISEC1_P0500 [Thiomicrorhabdus sp.]|nr:MAG: hypothetical protein ISEC1_P0500 [Thiomicrorhabdus sp.]
MNTIEISPINQAQYHELSIMVGELLTEIMNVIDEKVFNYDQAATELRAKELIENGKYWVFIATDSSNQNAIGFISLYESYALYAEGAYGAIPELYVRPGCRSQNIGQQLLKQAFMFAAEKGWKRLEVTTPPLPAFDKTLNFYQTNHFEIAGGRKLKIDIV